MGSPENDVLDRMLMMRKLRTLLMAVLGWVLFMRQIECLDWTSWLRFTVFALFLPMDKMSTNLLSESEEAISNIMSVSQYQWAYSNVLASVVRTRHRIFAPLRFWHSSSLAHVSGLKRDKMLLSMAQQ